MLPSVTLLPRRLQADCRAGAHRLGPAQQVSPGINRRLCVHCSHVSIDLTAADAAPDLSLFTDRAGTLPDRR
jgi:hypothetical protein